MSEDLTDAQVAQRTRVLLEAAEKISLELIHQTERLAAAIAMFDQQIIRPLRDELDKGSDGTAAADS